MPLPRPIGKQRDVLYLNAEGHTVVLGTAGSGKTTLAIWRAAHLATPTTRHYGRTLLLTFNRTLVTYLESIADGRLRDVDVMNYHRFARGYLQSRGCMRPNAICSRPSVREALVEEAVSATRSRHGDTALLRRPVGFFSDELRWIAQNGIGTLEEYQRVVRAGRGAAPIRQDERATVFAVLGAYRELRSQRGFDYDWDDVAGSVCAELRGDSAARRYRHVVIDEGQDFSPDMIRSCALAVPGDGSLTLFGDVAQQIYGHRISWRAAGLDITKPWLFSENYRNTKQIARLGLAVSAMPYFRDVPDIVEPNSPVADGPPPMLVGCPSVAAEAEFSVSRAVAAARTQSVAVLIRNRSDERLLSPYLPQGAIRLHRELTSWHPGPGLHYGTYHAAKGLEFDLVVMPFCSADRLPDPEIRDALGDDDAAARDGRLLYVGVTRARVGLLISYAGQVTSLLPQGPGLYQVGTYG